MKVAVVGCGISGLYAARRLEQNGAEVELYEARDRIGGRLLTFEQDGLAYETGGEWLDAGHMRALNLARALGIVPLPSPPMPRLAFHKGERAQEEALWPDAVEDEARFDREATSLLDVFDQKDVQLATLSRLDARSVADLIRARALSERGAWWLTAKYRSDEGEDLERIGLLGWLRTYNKYRGRASDSAGAFRVPGGFSGLIRKLADGLRAEPRLGKRLQMVEREQSKVVLGFQDGAKAEADHALLAMPPTTLLDVDFRPQVSPKKLEAWQAAAYGRVLKIALEFSSAWWIEAGWSGRMLTDRPIMQTWDGTLGERPVLTVYICGRAAESWSRFSNPPLGALEDLHAHFPQAKEHFVEGRVHSWTADPFCKGGYSYSPPGFAARHYEHQATLEGRIHFCGEHFAEWTGYVEGALESAERASTEIALA